MISLPQKWMKVFCLASFIGWSSAALSADPQAAEKASNSIAPATEQASSEPQISAEDREFFEAKIRPVLVTQCYSCHSQDAAKANKLKGGLLVDSRAGLLQGGDSGPAIDSKKPEQSLILEALRYESVQMPPQGKLAANVIADFERWVSRGAADPRTGPSAVESKKGIDLEAGRQHWAYRPVAKETLESIAVVPSNSASPIDTFILAKLASLGLSPADAAERTVLARRVYFDLSGLPPTPEEIDEFLADQSPDAYERLVDRLIASPHFGERWGRRWLSVARFGESLTLRGMVLPQAWRYRDYVIDFFNADRSFQEFIVEQLAGDLLPADSLDTRRRNVIATTYLAIGNVNLEEQDKRQLEMDIVDDQLDAISKGFLAQTITCARCHDHKFDPIPTKDYYAMAGILKNTRTVEHANLSKWFEFPLPLEPDREAFFAQHDAVVAGVKDKIKTMQDAIKVLTENSPPKIFAIKDLPGVVVDDTQAKVVGEWKNSVHFRSYIGDGYIHDMGTGKGDKTVTFVPEFSKAGTYEVRLAYTSFEDRCTAVPVTIFSADGERTITVNQKVPAPIDELFLPLGQYRFEPNGQGFVIISNEGTKGVVIVDAVQFIPVETLTAQTASEKPVPVDGELTAAQNEVRLKSELRTLQKEMEQLQKNGPQRPMYMSIQEEKEIADIPIHVRGSVHNLGEKVPRGYLQVALTGQAAVPKDSQSGRKELGEWIASSDNPLTARVLSNRLWYWMYGCGLVRTPDNFGTTGETPSNPELLDYVTTRLLDSQWSVKRVIRELVLSATYRQSSKPTARQISLDPENQRFSHQNRRRLEPECLLDAILSIDGQLQTQMGGNTIRPGTSEDYKYEHKMTRRAVYWPVLRNSLPEIFEVFDFADPSIPTGIRHASTVAPQALFALNDDWITGEARFAAQKLLDESLPDDTARIQRAFRLTLGRMPTPKETQLAEQSLAGLPVDRAWANLFQALFATIDFRYVE